MSCILSPLFIDTADLPWIIKFKMEDGDNLTRAAANGDEKYIKLLLESGADPNSYSTQGFLPTCIAAFWGYSSIMRQLLDSGADINGHNKGTLWTPLHCAAFQGHGKVVMTIMEYKPDLHLKDSKGRTAADFASAIESIWPFFAAADCKRTPKSELIRLDIVKKVSNKDIQQIPKDEKAYFSRPGSAYVMKTQSLNGSARTSRVSFEEEKDQIALSNGDVLLDGNSPAMNWQDRPSFNAWRN